MKFLINRPVIIFAILTLMFVSTFSIEMFLTNQKISFLTGNNTKSAKAKKVKGSNSTITNKTLFSRVSSPPYKILTCDQVIELPGKNLTDLNDFTKKASAFYTISTYMVNQFDTKDGNTLRTSISLDKILNYPAIMQGSVSCISFTDLNLKQITMCLPDKETANQVLNSFNKFMKCRMGDNLKDTPAETIQRILKASCLGLDVNFDIQKFGGDLNKAKAALKNAINTALTATANNLKGSLTRNRTINEKRVIDGRDRPE